jgi:ABC-type dipeptide/oligopeptide/nickel transport system permease subunit
MTEPTVSPPGHAEDVAPRSAAIEGGEIIAPVGVVESTAAAGLELQVRSQWSYARMRFFRHRLAMVGLVGLVVIFGAGIFANYVAPFPLGAIDLNNLLHAPTTVDHHYFGTDAIGADEFSRVLYGIRTSLEVGVFVAAVSSIIGLVIGAVAGYFGGLLDNLLMRITDLVLTLPALAILLAVSALLSGKVAISSQWLITFILTGFFWTGIARVVRGVFLSLREKEYVEAAKASGAGSARIMFRHILPNTMGPVVVNGTLAVGTAILTEAALSFLGFGITPPATSLGALVADGQNYPKQWWLTIFPGVTIVLIVLCVNFVGDGLRDALDPQQRRVRA